MNRSRVSREERLSGLTAKGLLLMFAVIEKIPEAIKDGRNIKVQKGEISLEVTTETPLE